jgi:large subunit ribosomal protein L10
MKRKDKETNIALLKSKFEDNSHFYVTDSSTLNVEQVNKLRGMCYEKGIEMKVVKNTLAIKALDSIEGIDYSQLYDALKGPTTLMFAETSNMPAKVIKEFRKSFKRPILKAAFIDSDIFLGDDQIDMLVSLKSKEELIGDVIMLLQSPAKNVISALKSGGSTIAGLLKSLQEREQS